MKPKISDQASKLPAQRQWEHYVASYNEIASRIGGRLIPLKPGVTLGQMTRGDALKYMTWAEAQDEKVRFLEGFINDIDALAKMGFDHSHSQRVNATGERSPKLNAIVRNLATASEYRDYTNNELWDELISLAEGADLTITEFRDTGELEWDDTENDHSGTLKRSSFGAKLAKERRLASTLKRGRKKNKS